MQSRYSWLKLLVVTCILSFCVLPHTVIQAQFLPLAVAGYVTFPGGNPAPDGTNVIITNMDNGDTVTVQTGLGTGLYAGTVMGEDGDIINVSAGVGGQDGFNSSTADTSLVTNWINILISSGPPIACFTYSPSSPSVDELITFNECSFDPDGAIVSYHWEFGDGDSYGRRDATHRYGAEETYRVALTVTDNDGLIGVERKYITIGGDDWFQIPPFEDPLYPDNPFTVPEMYNLLRANVGSTNEVVIVVIDSGSQDVTYGGVDLGNVICIRHPTYASCNDEYGHGTFVNYIIQYGIETYSNNVVQYSLRAFDRNGGCSLDTFLECIDIALEFDPDIVTISAGIIGTPTDMYSQGVSKLRDAGVFVTVSAGNAGPLPSTISSPALSEDAIAVGATDPRQPGGVKSIMDLSDDRVTIFSSRGPVPGIYPKPDFTAPGESIIGPWIGGDKVGSGTSLSAPFVAACALQIIASNKPVLDIVKFIYSDQLYLEIIESSLIESTYDKGEPDAYGWGIPNAQIAVQHAFIKAIFYIALFIVFIAVIVIGLVIIIYAIFR